MSSVHLCGLSKKFGDQAVLGNLDLTVESGTYLVLLGPSGCGKTTTLRVMSGLEVPDAGQVMMDGRDVTKVPPRKRDVSMVFQNDGLYPHLNVEQTIRLALRGRCHPSDKEARFCDAVSLTGVGEILTRSPGQLSGGELRRAAIATAIAKRTSIRLLDEPLSALDIPVREQLQADILRWHAEVSGTTIHVTHDGSEAMRMADQIAVMDRGRIIQTGTPEAVYDQPHSMAVAKAIGTPTMNWLQGEVVGGVLLIDQPDVTANGGLRVDSANGDVMIGVRPSAFEVGDLVEDVIQTLGVDLRALLQDCRLVEGALEVTLSANNQILKAVFDRSVQRFLPSVGGVFPLHVPVANVHLFSCLTEQRLKLHGVG